MARFKATWKLLGVWKREMLERRKSEWVVLLLPTIVVVTCGWLVAAGRPFSSRLDGQASTAWRFLGPSINLDFEKTAALRGSSWTLDPCPAGEAWASREPLGEPSSLGASFLALRAGGCSGYSTTTTEMFHPFLMPNRGTKSSSPVETCDLRCSPVCLPGLCRGRQRLPIDLHPSPYDLHWHQGPCLFGPACSVPANQHSSPIQTTPGSRPLLI